MPVERHALNKEFAWPECVADGGGGLNADQVQRWNQAGYLLLKNFFAAETIQALEAEIDRYEAGIADTVLTMADQPEIKFARDEISFTRQLALKSGLVRNFLLSAAFKHLMAALIGPAVRLYWDQAVYKKPDKAQVFPWHQDNGYTFLRPQAYVTCWIPLVDATETNGCPWVMPGVHRQGTLTHIHDDRGLAIKGLNDTDPRAICCPCSPGDMLVFSSLTPHKTGPNLTQSVRKALIAQYISDGAVMVGPDGSEARLEGAERPRI